MISETEKVVLLKVENKLNDGIVNLPLIPLQEVIMSKLDTIYYTKEKDVNDETLGLLFESIAYLVQLGIELEYIRIGNIQEKNV